MKRLVAYTGLQLEKTDVIISRKRTVIVTVRIVILAVLVIIRLDPARTRSTLDCCSRCHVLGILQCPLFDEERFQMTIGTQTLEMA